MSLRLRLLLLSLLTLALPWAGCEYARKMESVQRKGQEDALLTTARVLARVIATNSEVVEQSFPQASGVAAESASPLFAAQLLTHPLLDGFADEWPHPAHPLPNSGEDKNDLRLGLYGGALYAFLHVHDNHVVYETPSAESSDEESSRSPNAADRVVLLSRDLTGIDRAWSISAVAPGPTIVRTANPEPPWQPQENIDDDIHGAWRATNDGYDVELRIPQRIVGAAFAMAAVDNAEPTLHPIVLHPLHTASAALRNQLDLYAPAGVRLSIVDTQGWLLARAGTLQNPQSVLPDDDHINFYRWLLDTNEQSAPAYGLPYGMWGEPVDTARQGKSSAIWFQAGGGEPSTVRAAVPIVVGNKVLGVLAVEQAAEQLLIRHDAIFASLFQRALLVTFLAVVFVIAFAAWLSRRIRRLSIAATTALSPEGRIEQRLPETTAHDEIGDLARSFASLLHRIKDYAGYLQTLGAKLSHEFRTPLAIVSSSLENLAAEKNNSTSQQQFIDRARAGTVRLQTILSAMTEATRVEQSIEQAERVKFDLAELVRSAGTAYGQTFLAHRFDVNVPTHACLMRGAPELIMQMLDKLVDNAVDFCPPQGLITLELQAMPHHYRLSIANEGPPLPAEFGDKIFDVLVSNRTASADKPHLGLGLFIVQLIARFHDGRATASNLANDSGVKFQIELPREV